MWVALSQGHTVLLPPLLPVVFRWLFGNELGEPGSGIMADTSGLQS